MVKHTFGRSRRFRPVAEVSRHGRNGHAAWVRAIAGLVNRTIGG